MDVNKVSSKEGLKWKCREHPNASGSFIHLEGNSRDRVMCFFCAQQHQIPLSNQISMSYILAAKEDEILEGYPPLKDQGLLNKLKDASFQQQLEQIEVYFKKLREDFEKEVKAAEQRAKQSLIKQDKAYYELLEGYSRIAEVEKLKQLIVSEKESAEKDLDSFIKEKWNKAEENRKIIADLFNQYESEQYFLSDEPNRIAQELISSLKNITFFQQPLQQQSQVTLIKSTYASSDSMEITKIDKSIYQVKQGIYDGNFNLVFIDPVLDPSKKYILNIELEQKHGTNTNAFFFGLAKDQGKDNNAAQSQNMCYYDLSNSYGITKYIKGSPMQSGIKVIGKHSFEIRIYLNQKFLRVASLPNYSSIAELDDLNKIDPKVVYRFFLSMLYRGDMMRIIDIRTISNFDEKM